jgi:hypothetical protein
VSETSLRDLTPAELEGLAYAEALAGDHKYCSELPPWRRDEQPLTIEQLADERGLPVAVVRGRITRARHIFFGELTDAAIEKRAQRQRPRKPRSCEEPGCDAQIPPTAPANRLYCPSHSTSAARVRRHRRDATAT